MIEPLVHEPPGVSYRVLSPGELVQIRPIFTERGVDMPSGGIYLGAVENGRIIGFCVLQLKLHTEPLWIAPGKSQTFHGLVSFAENYIVQNSGPTWVHLFASNPEIEKLAEAMGMERIDQPLFQKLVGAPPPKGFSDLMPIEDLEADLDKGIAVLGELMQNPFDDSPLEGPVN